MHGDPRVKNCAYCGRTYRDRTRPNNSKTCSRECKTAWDTERRAIKRRSERKPLPRDFGQPEGYQFWRPDYPFWVDRRKMENYWYRNEVHYDIDAIDAVVTQRQIYGEGNRRKFTSEIEY